MTKAALRNPPIIADLFVGLVLVAAFVTAVRNYPVRASILIYLISVVGFLLVCMDVATRVRRLRPAAGERVERKIHDTRDEADERPARERRLSVLDTWGWYFGMLLAIGLVGVELGIPVTALLYSKMHGGRWLPSILIAVLLGGVIILVFNGLMNIPWPRPLLPLV